jgi:hypothetical protein
LRSPFGLWYFFRLSPKQKRRIESNFCRSNSAKDVHKFNKAETRKQGVFEGYSNASDYGGTTPETETPLQAHSVSCGYLNRSAKTTDED